MGEPPLRIFRQWIAPIWVFCFALSTLLSAQNSLNPDFERRLATARETRRLGRLDAALAELSALLPLLADTPGTAVLQAQTLGDMGEIYAARNDLARAATCFEKSLALDPAQGVVHYRLGLVYRDIGQPAKAALQFEACIQHGFVNLGVNFNLISAYFLSRQSAEGVERATRLIAAPPRSPDLWLRLGRVLFTHLYYNEALQAFRLASDQAPQELEPRFYLALTHFLLNQYSETVRVLSSFQHSDPESANLLAASQARSGSLDQAVELLRNTIAQAPRSPHAFVNLALIRLEQGQSADAERLLDRFRSLGPQRDTKVFYSVSHNSCLELETEIRRGQGHAEAEKANFYFDLASQMQDRYHYASAVDLLRLARPYEGKSARLLQAAGLNCLNLQSPEAASLLSEAVSIEPLRHEAWHLLGRAYLRQGDFDAALAALRKATVMQPRASYWISLGKALLSSTTLDAAAERREAQGAFEQAVALEPSNAIAHYELGRLLSQLDNFDGARAHLMRAVDLEPDFYEAYYTLSRVCSRTGETEQSQKYLAIFERTKSAVVRQSVVGSGYIGEGRER